MTKNTINLAIVDDHTIFRKILSDYLSQNDFKITLQASDATDFLTQLEAAKVDIVIMDLFMPKINSIDAIKIIRHEFPDMKIIILSVCRDIKIVSSLLDIGINAYVSKSEEPRDLIRAVTAISEDKIFRNELYTEALFLNREISDKKEKRQSIILDDREKQVIQLLWEEKSNKEIAGKLYLSIRTVEKVRQDLKEKLEFKSIAGLFKYALSQGIISLQKNRVHNLEINPIKQ
ncbi:MAG TPA: response regulator transcription factor [Puia sp.]|nr:response regulator transcription factor [Puia sp.]